MAQNAFDFNAVLELGSKDNKPEDNKQFKVLKVQLVQAIPSFVF